MELGEFVKGVLDRNEEYVLKAVEGVTLEELLKMPAPDVNSMGWLLWHLARVQDRITSILGGTKQVWISEGWHAKFGRRADPDDRGNGDTPAQVAAFKVASVKLLVDYYKASKKHVDAYLATVKTSDLERLVPGMQPGTTVPLAQRLNALVLECCQHGGQIAFVRGYAKGKGWWAS